MKGRCRPIAHSHSVRHRSVGERSFSASMEPTEEGEPPEQIEADAEAEPEPQLEPEPEPEPDSEPQPADGATTTSDSSTAAVGGGVVQPEQEPVRIAIIGPGAGTRNPNVARCFTKLAGVDGDTELFPQHEPQEVTASSGGEHGLSSEHVLFRHDHCQLCLCLGGDAGEGGHEQLYAYGQSLHEDMVRFAPTLLYCGSRGGLILTGLLASWKPSCPLLVVNAFGRERALLCRESDSDAEYRDAEHNNLAQRVPPGHAIENDELVLILVQCGDSDVMSRGRNLREEFASFAGAVLVYHNRNDEHVPASLQRVIVDLHRAAQQLHQSKKKKQTSEQLGPPEALLERFLRHTRGSPFAPPAPCEFSLKLAGEQEWAVLSSSTFATYSSDAGGAAPPRGLMAAIQARAAA